VIAGLVVGWCGFAEGMSGVIWSLEEVDSLLEAMLYIISSCLKEEVRTIRTLHLLG
jgi:hypothetical protein